MEARPNIVLILADDLGAGDPGCYNPESLVPTPNIDELARKGIRLTNAYCPDAICTPSRYALMTGRYPWRTGRTHGVLFNWEPAMIEPGRITLPELLRRAGYVTGGFGKWHLGAEYTTLDGRPPVGQFTQRHPEDGRNADLSAPLREGPLDRGFTDWFGFICVSESLVYDGLLPAATVDVYPHPKAPGIDELQHIAIEDYLPEVTRRAIEFVRGQAAAPREQRKPFFLYFAPYVPHVPLAVPDRFRGVTRGGDYGDYVAALDHAVGELVEAVERASEETLIIFASDNGSQFDVTGQGHRPNGRLNGRKGMVLEGGVRTPLIVSWPGRVKPGTSSHALAALTDILATVAAATGQSLPPDGAEDSVNLLPVLTGEAASARESLIVKAGPPQLALRRDEWKYVAEACLGLPGSDPAHAANPYVIRGPQLFNLDDDPGESRDLCAQHPEVAAEMRQLLLEIANGADAKLHS